MPITIAQIQALTHLSNANFKKRECQFCKGEFYSIRETKWCCGACKQSAYRMRLLSEENQSKEKPEEEKPISFDSDGTLEIEENIKRLNEKLKLTTKKI